MDFIPNPVTVKTGFGIFRLKINGMRDTQTPAMGLKLKGGKVNFKSVYVSCGANSPFLTGFVCVACVAGRHW